MFRPVHSGSGRAGPPQRVRFLTCSSGSGWPERERSSAVMAMAGDGETLIFLHRLQELRTGLRGAGPRLILVGHQELGEDRGGAGSGRSGVRSRPAPSLSEPRMSGARHPDRVVNGMRLESSPSTTPSVSTSLVFARPGTPTRSAWPPARIATSRAFNYAFPGPKMTTRPTPTPSPDPGRYLPAPFSAWGHHLSASVKAGSFTITLHSRSSLVCRKSTIGAAARSGHQPLITALAQDAATRADLKLTPDGCKQEHPQ